MVSIFCISYMMMITSVGSKCAKWVSSTGRLGKMVSVKAGSSYRAVVTIITNAHSPIVMIVRLLIEVPEFKKAVSRQNLMEVIYGMSGVTFSMISINMYLD